MLDAGEPQFDLEALNRELRAHLEPHPQGRQSMVSRSLPSTQDTAKGLGREGGEEGSVVWALEQTAGRGRLGRSWQAPLGGLWFSILLRPKLRAEAAAFLSIVAGVAAADVLRETGRDVRLKWPNDLLLGGRKLGGMLSEAEVDGDRVSFVVIGIGINLEPLPDEVLAEVGEAAWLRDGSALPSPSELVARLVNAVERAYHDYMDNGPSAARARWLELSDTIGRRVRAETPTFTIEGDAFDLEPDGALVLRTPEMKSVRIHSGEVVHLRPISGTATSGSPAAEIKEAGEHRNERT